MSKDTRPEETLYGIIQLEVTTMAAWRELARHFFENLDVGVNVRLIPYQRVRVNLDEIEEISEEDMNGRVYKRWTEEEEERLKRDYPVKPVNDISVEMARTNQSIRQKALELGLSRRE